MTTVASGSKVLVHGPRAIVPLRSLRTVTLDGGWSVAVLGDLGALQAAGVSAAGVTGPLVEVEFATDEGPLVLDAELVISQGVFLLRAPGLRTAAMIEQRRENVRAIVRMPFSGAVLEDGAPSSRVQAGLRLVEGGSTPVTGTTRTVSGGGLSLELPGAARLSPGTMLYLELELPAGDLAPAVVRVIGQDGAIVRARFVDISALNRERLVRLVFTRQRVDLAERRRTVGTR
jgi:PilZ domain